MVKNDAGGNKGKGLARKHVNAAKCGSTKQLRVATDAAERYAIVSKMLGNGMCYVRLLDGSTRDRLCIIRNKFKGRGKRDNILDSGSWVLVGMREWSSKQDTCDLLEVYNAAERDRLQKNEPVFKTVEVSNNGGNNGSSNDGNNNNGSNNTNTNTNSSNSVQFADSTTMKYSSMLNKGASASADSDDDVPMQQRVYDMPPSDQSDEEAEEEEEEADQEEEESDQEEEESDQEESDQEEDEADQEEDEADQEVQVQQVHKSNAKKSMNKCEINVDDI